MHFQLWVSDDPAAPRADLSTGVARLSEPSPVGAFEAVRATVPYVSRHGARHGTDEPGSSHSENGRSRMGADGYPASIFAAFEAGYITEDEWKQGERAHRFVVAAERLR